jgi:hypothetical protein
VREELFEQKINVVYSKETIGKVTEESATPVKEAIVIACKVKPLFSLSSKSISLEKNEKGTATLELLVHPDAKVEVTNIQVQNSWIDRCKLSGRLFDLEILVPTTDKASSSVGSVIIRYKNESGNDFEAELPFSIFRVVKFSVLGKRVLMSMSNDAEIWESKVWIRSVEPIHARDLTAKVLVGDRSVNARTSIIRQSKDMALIELQLEKSLVGEEFVKSSSVTISLGENECVSVLDFDSQG